MMESELIDAIRRGDVKVVQELIEKGANVNYVPSRGKTPLSSAAAAGHVPIMLALRNTPPPDPNSNHDYYLFQDEESPEGTEELEWDTEMSDVDGEGESGGDGEDVWSRQYRWYADILAKTAGLTRDLGRTCDLDLQDCAGRTALHYAVEQTQVDALHWLFDAGCKIDISDADGLTPLHLAAMRGHIDVARALLCRGASVNRKTADKMAPLHYAAAKGYLQMVRLLVEEGEAHVDPLDTSDRTPLMLAVIRGHLETVAALIGFGANVNIEEIHGYSPLCEAVWGRSVPLAELLLRSGAKVTQSQHLLHYAALHGDHQMAALLLTVGGAYPNLRDDRGDTPLLVAVRAADLTMAELLLRHNANPSCTNSVTGVTCLEAALLLSDGQFERLVALFCDFGADLDQSCQVQFSERSSALAFCVLMGMTYKAAVLVRAGADVSEVDVNTLCQGPPSLVRLIVSAGLDLSRVEALQYPKDFSSLKPEESILDWLTVAKFNAPRLSSLCRLALRAQTRHKTLSIVPQLHIPTSLKAFLLLQDVHVEKIYDGCANLYTAFEL